MYLFKAFQQYVRTLKQREFAVLKFLLNLFIGIEKLLTGKYQRLPIEGKISSQTFFFQKIWKNK